MVSKTSNPPKSSSTTSTTGTTGSVGYGSMDANAEEAINLTHKAGALNNKVTLAEMEEKLTKKGYDAAKGLIG